MYYNYIIIININNMMYKIGTHRFRQWLPVITGWSFVPELAIAAGTACIVPAGRGTIALNAGLKRQGPGRTRSQERQEHRRP